MGDTPRCLKCMTCGAFGNYGEHKDDTTIECPECGDILFRPLH